MAIIDRIKTRLDGEIRHDDEYLRELATTVTDRILLRVGERELPTLLESIAVDATVKLYRRRYYDGVKSEGDDGMSVTFVDDILDEYAAEFTRYRVDFAKSKDGAARGLVRFL